MTSARPKICISCTWPATMNWTKLSPLNKESERSPMKKFECRLVHFGSDRLALLADHGSSAEHVQPGSTFTVT